MALDIYSTPPMSDEPERVFSEGGNLLVPRRRQLSGDHVQEILCLKSWQGSGLVTLDGALFDQAIRVADGAPINDEIATVALNNSDDDEDDEVV
jgi:hypothetical protein